MTSLLASLAKIGKTRPIVLPGGLQTRPPSLREAVRIMNLPKPDPRQWQRRMVHDFSENDAQGIAYARHDLWFLSSQWNLFKVSITGSDLFHPTSFSRIKQVGLGSLIQDAGLTPGDYDHISDVSWHNHLLFLVARCTHAGQPHLLVATSDNLHLVAFCDLPADVGDSWVAIEPWSGLGCLQNRTHDDRFDLYDLVDFYRVLSQPHRWRSRVRLRSAATRHYRLFMEDGFTPDAATSVQGIAFSNNGRLYIARYDGSGPWDNFLQVYDSLTGRRLGRREYDFPGTWDEIEGLTVHPSGVLYIAVADNDWPSTDEFEIHAIKNQDTSIPL